MGTNAGAGDGYLRMVIDSIPGLVAFVDAEFRYRFTNNMYAERFGRMPDDLPGRSMAEVLEPELYEAVLPRLNEALAGKRVAFEVDANFGGEMRCYRPNYEPQFDSQGNIDGLLLTIFDITAEKRAENALRESEEGFRSLLANTPDIIARFGPDLRFRYISPAVEAVLGIPKAEYIGRTHAEVGVPDDLAHRLESRLREIFDTGEQKTVSFEMPTTNGLRHYEGAGIPERAADGSIKSVLTIVRDTTAEFLAVEQLRASELKFRTIVETAAEGVWIVDAAGITRFANQSLCEMLGYGEGGMIGVSYAEVLERGEIPKARENFRRRGEPVVYRTRRKDGTSALLQISPSLLFDASGAMTSVVGLVTDVTRRVESEALLKASEERYRSLVVATSSIVWTADPAGHLIGDTSAWVQYTGREVSNEPRPWEKFLHPDDVPAAREAWLDAVRDDGVLEHTARVYHAASQQYRWCITRAVPLRNDDGALREWIGATTDIHDRRDAETRYSALFDASRDGILIIDDAGRYVDVNPGYCKLLRATREQLLGSDYVPFIPEDRRDDAQRAFELLKSEGRFENEFPLVAADGARVELEWTAVANFVPGLHCCMARDITEKKRFEQQLQQTQKLESLGVLAGGIAHDFNNLLVGMMGNASLAMDALPVSSPARPMMEDVMKASDRAALLTRQLLAYAGKTRLSAEIIDLSELVRELTGLLSASIPRTAHLRLQLPAEPLPVEGDPIQLQQIVMNLVINGAESIPNNRPGTVTVSGCRRALNEHDRHAAVISIPPGASEYAVLTVTDTGSGMPPEVRDRIFDPFFTTKFQGRGLGLSAVLGIIQSHRGMLTLQSEPGQGTTFEVILPLSDLTVKRDSSTQKANVSSRGGTVLVVDDEAVVRTFLERLLARAGFEVIVAANGREALHWLAEERPVSAVILDLAMPVLTGDQAAPEIRRLRPQLPIVLSSGYPETEAMERFAHTGVNAFLQKPYAANALLKSLNTLLNRHSGAC